MADILRSDHIWRSEKISQTNEDKMLQALGHADSEGHCLWAVLFLDLKEISSDLLQGLFPGYALPFAFAALSRPLEGMPETVRVCQSIRRCHALRAYITLTQVALRVPLHPDNLIIFHTDQKATSPMVHPGAMRLHPANVIFHMAIHPFDFASSCLYHAIM